MELAKAAALAADKMLENDLAHWGFKWSKACTIYGQCDHKNKTLILSQVLVAAVDELHVLDTILHEIAHALVGPGNGHNTIWKAKARELGCFANATSDTVVDVPHKWEMVFGNEIIKKYYRKPNKSTFAKIGDTWVNKRKAETYGKLELRKV